MLLRSLGVSACRHDEEIHIRAARSDRLLLDPPDGQDRPVESQLASRRDLASVSDVASELARDLESEGKTRGWAADSTEVDVDIERKLDVRGLVNRDADDGPVRLGWTRNRTYRQIERFPTTADRQSNVVPRLATPDLTT
jgi:hypothetical protein